MHELQDLIPFLNEGSKGITKFGVSISGDFAKKANGIICYFGLLNEENIINLKGEIQKVPFGIADYREIFVHVSDTIFLQHWLNNKHYNLIK